MRYRLDLDSRARRLATFGLFYLSEGIPIGFSTIALAAYLRRLDASMAVVGAIVAASYAPWAFKWAWAPLVDLVRIRRLGPSRAWILLCQSMMIATLGVLFAFDLTSNAALLTSLLLVHNTFAATQDVAIDAMAVRVLPMNEVGLANGLMFGAQYLGIGLGGGGALYVAAAWGFRASLAFILLSMAALLVGVTIPLREPPDSDAREGERVTSVMAAVASRLRTFLRDLRAAMFGGGPGPLTGALFAFCPQGAMALNLAVVTGLQVDMKLSEATIGSIALLSNVTGGLGSIVGGWLSDRSGSPRTCLAGAYVLSAAATFWLSLQFTGPGVVGILVPVFIATVVVYQIAFGIQTGAAAGLYMRLSSPAVAATQFTAFMALRNMSSSYSSAWQGWFVDQHGYAATLRLDALLALVGLLILPWVVTARRAVR